MNLIHAQPPGYRMQEIRVTATSNPGEIRHMQESVDGFLWFVGKNDLFRYDGYDFRIFQPVMNDSQVLAGRYDDRNFYITADNQLYFFITTAPDQLYRLRTDGFFEKIKGPQLAYFTATGDKNSNAWFLSDFDEIGKVDPRTYKLKSLYYDTKWKNRYQYNDSVYAALPALRKHRIAIIDKMPADTLITKSFKIDKPVRVLVYCIGNAGDNSGKLNESGWLDCHGRQIFGLDLNQAKYAGGLATNICMLKLYQLLPGTYVLNYKTSSQFDPGDYKHSDRMDTGFYGIEVLDVSNAPWLNETWLQRLGYDSTHLIPLDHSNTGYGFLTNAVENKDGSISWIYSSSLINYSASENKFEEHPLNFSYEENDKNIPDHLQQFTDSLYWLIAEDHIFLLNKMGSLKASYKLKYPVNSILTVNQCLSDSSGLWITTSNGLIKLKYVNEKFQQYQFLEDRNIISITRDMNGNLWFGMVNSLLKLTPNRHSLIDLPANGEDDPFPGFNPPRVLLSNRYLVFPDTLSGNKMNMHILDISNEAKQQLINLAGLGKDDAITDILADRTGDCWMAAGNKLFKYRSGGSKFMQVSRLPELCKIKRLIYSSNNQLIIFSSRGIYKYDPAGNKLDKLADFMLNSLPPSSIANAAMLENEFIDIRETAEGNFLFRSFDKLYILNSVQKRILPLMNSSVLGSGIFLNWGNIFMDAAGQFWLAHANNISSIGKQNEVNTYTLQDFDMNRHTLLEYQQSCIEQAGKYLFVSSDNGLFRFDPVTHQSRVFRKKEGLQSDDVRYIHFDGKHTIWIVTNESLSSMDLSTEIITNHFSDFKIDGFRTKLYTLPDSSYLIIGSHLACRFKPADLIGKQPIIRLTSFKLNRQDYHLDTMISDKRFLKLKYYQNFISLGFAILDLTDPARNRYEYMLEGLDRNWVRSDFSDRTAMYTKLRPGNYIFKVRGADAQGNWSASKPLVIIITPPWWETIVAYVSYILLFIFGLYTYIKLRERNLVREKLHLEAIVRQRTAQIEKQKEEIEVQRDVVIKQRDVIAEHEASITDSIKYAYKIQNALFPNQCDFEQVSKDYFIYYKPRDIVSGDFYWLGHADSRMVVIAADCTGHGVPGAMMSMLGVAFLNEIVERDGIAEPSKILDNLRKRIIHALKQHGAEMEQKDGMDIAAIAIDIKNKILEFAGANNPLFLLRNDELIETKGDKMPVAIHQHMEPFTNHQLTVHEGDSLYIFSDGYPSQFGGPEGKKLMNKNFRAIILEMKDLPMSEQRLRIEQQFISWQGNYEQVDDVLVIGLKI